MTKSSNSYGLTYTCINPKMSHIIVLSINYFKTYKNITEWKPNTSYKNKL